MKKFILLSFCVFLALSTQAQNTRKFTLNITHDGASTLTCFLPEAAKATGRSVVVCPGGGYATLSMQHEGTDWAEYFNNQGIACFVLKYRLPHGDRSLPISDAENAIRLVRDSAASWHLNPYDVGIMGFSAGGHLASTVCTHADFASRPDFAILFYPVISMDPNKGHSGSSYNLLGQEGVKNNQLVNAYSNERQVRRHLTPPAIILLANDDRAVPPVTNGVAYYIAMRNAGNECSLHIYPEGGHGWGFNKDFKYHDIMLSDLSSWLRQLPSYPANALRVACIGNSITDGARIDMADEFGYPARLQQLLGQGYHVRNFGVSGRIVLKKGDWPFTKELAWRDALAFNPDIVVFKLGTNDSKARNWRFKSDFRNDLQAMIDTLKALPAHPKIYLVYPLVANCPVNNDGDINETIIKEEIIPIIDKVAKKNKCQIIDMRADMNHTELMTDDGVHPNAKGAEVMAQHVAASLKAQK